MANNFLLTRKLLAKNLVVIFNHSIAYSYIQRVTTPNHILFPRDKNNRNVIKIALSYGHIELVNCNFDVTERYLAN